MVVFHFPVEGFEVNVEYGGGMTFVSLILMQAVANKLAFKRFGGVFECEACR